MSQEVTGIFNTNHWDEKTYKELEGEQKLTRVDMLHTCTGEIEGESAIEYTMFYKDKDTASFVGMERFVGRVGERVGSFVVQASGVFENGVVVQSGTILEGSGTGDFEGVKGGSDFSIKEHKDYPITYRLEFNTH